jgi:hypothetical protein
VPIGLTTDSTDSTDKALRNTGSFHLARFLTADGKEAGERFISRATTTTVRVSGCRQISAL